MLSSEQFNDIDPTVIYYKLFIALNTHVNKKGVQTKQDGGLTGEKTKSEMLYRDNQEARILF